MQDMTEQEKRVIHKVAWKLVPFLVFAYLLCYIDRVNIGFAALTMNKDLGITATVYGMGAGILFLGYFIFEVPSNIAMNKFGARIWIARIMITWGIVACSMALINSVTSFLVLRFLLGVAEAGFFPGIIFYLSFWFPERHRGVITSRFMFAQPIALMLGSAVSGWVLQLNGVMGIAGWKWLFIVEGLPTILVGIIAYKYLTDRPADAKWLDDEDREWLKNELAMEAAHVEIDHEKHSILGAMVNPKVLMLGISYFLLAIGTMGICLWLPQIVKSFGGLSNINVGMISAIPFLFTSIGMLIYGKHSDATKERKWHITIGYVFSGICLALSALTTTNLTFTIILITLSLMGAYAAMPIFWTMPSMFLTGGAAAVGIAAINSIGNLGGWAGPFVIGWAKATTGSFKNSLAIIGMSIILNGLLSYHVYGKIEKENKIKLSQNGVTVS